MNLQTSSTGLEDEDQQMDGERLAEDAKDSVLFLAAFTEVKSQHLNSKFLSQQGPFESCVVEGPLP